MSVNIVNITGHFKFRNDTTTGHLESRNITTIEDFEFLNTTKTGDLESHNITTGNIINVDLNFSLWMNFPQSFSHLSQFA
jgi:hypothetical protein